MFEIPLTRPYISPKVKDSVLEVLDSGHLTEGPVTRKLEKTVSEYVGANHCLAVTSCTTGLELALRAIGVGPGDEVIVPDYTYPATANVVAIVGAQIVLVDVDPVTMLIDYDDLERAVTPATKAILPVSTFGNPLDYERLFRLKEKHNFQIIEDAACSLGAEYRDRRVGAVADITVFSLHPRKILTTGEGGLVMTDSDNLAEWMKSYKHFGQDLHHGGSSRDAIFRQTGTNYKMSDILAAVGMGQLEDIDLILQERRYLAEGYQTQLANIPDITLPRTTSNGLHAYQSFCVLLENRNQIMDTLRGQGIEVQIGTYALHRQPAFRDNPDCRLNSSLKNSNWVFDHCLALPLFHGMTPEEQTRVVKALCQAME